MSDVYELHGMPTTWAEGESEDQHGRRRLTIYCPCGWSFYEDDKHPDDNHMARFHYAHCPQAHVY